MKKFFALIIVVVLFTSGAIAQVLDPPGPIHLRAWNKGLNEQEKDTEEGISKNRRAIPYVHQREADVMWAKRVWQEIDLRQKINHPLYYPEQPVRHRKSLMQTLLDAANEGLVVYKDEDFKLPMNPSELEDKMNRKDTITVPNPFDPNYDTIMVIDVSFNTADVWKYWIIEDWFFCRERSVLEKRIIAIAPITERPIRDETTGEFIDRRAEIFFWVYFPHARPYLARTETFNRFNDTERMSFDDLFFKRMFEGRIIKVDNVHDRFIVQYQLGLDVLLEADRIKNEFNTFEMDLWEY